MSSPVEDLMSVLAGAGLGTVGTTIFGSLLAVIPAGAGPFTHLIEYGAETPDETHDDIGTNIDRPRIQISVHATVYTVARAHAKACHRVLSKIINEVINGTEYKRVVPLQSPFELPLDANNRSVQAFNVQADMAAT